MSKREPKVRLLHMRDFARKAISLIENKSKADLIEEEVLRLAVTHLVELVGEAASQIPREIQEEYPQIPCPKSSECETGLFTVTILLTLTFFGMPWIKTFPSC